MGGKPSKGTKADKRLKENKDKSRKNILDDGLKSKLKKKSK